ncbi:hypothetical protein A8709_21320 [Paenibacillus pectinilyticus]|uniref:DNA-binding response regulator n=1 Tax=Paenibacillus pectinilyticus TaxID=512399 RepID=A0A1C0ZXK9_9BACL|nr:response regulator [Paenibacillus pectinilyticus]OCT12875.1 hypothetical protein A8709_21320 [Paenibacillus pectinilyticus]
MIRIMIVDDEEWIRLGLREQIDWSSLGTEIVGEAQNGRVALQMLDELRPDIVLTDIRMPVMDGITLLEHAHQAYPDIIFIVISGFAEFEYARKALTYRVFDYLLKPIEEDKLEASIQNAVAIIKENEKTKQDLIDLRIQLNESSHLSREKFLTSLLTGSHVGVEEMTREMDRNQLSFNWPYFMITVVKVENFTEITARHYNSESNVSSFVINNVISELVEHIDNMIVFRNYTKQDELVMIKGFDDGEYQETIQELTAECNRIITSVKSIIRFELYMGMSSGFASMKDAAQSYTQAVEAVRHAGMVHHSRIVQYDEITRRNDYFIYPDDKEKSFLYYLENGYSKQVTDMIEDFFREINNSQSLHPQSIRNTVLELCMLMNKTVKKYQGLLEDILQESNLPDKITNELFSSAALENWLKQSALKALYFIQANKKVGSKKALDDIVAYLQAHYAENINLNSVAETYFINPAYLSRIFKNQMGQNFNEYVSKIRMDAAARLLQQDHLKLSDISLRVGYENVNYFLKKFKEHFGCTPSEYKKVGKM